MPLGVHRNALLLQLLSQRGRLLFCYSGHPAGAGRVLRLHLLKEDFHFCLLLMQRLDQLVVLPLLLFHLRPLHLRLLCQVCLVREMFVCHRLPCALFLLKRRHPLHQQHPLSVQELPLRFAVDHRLPQVLQQLREIGVAVKGGWLQGLPGGGGLARGDVRLCEEGQPLQRLQVPQVLPGIDLNPHERPQVKDLVPAGVNCLQQPDHVGQAPPPGHRLQVPRRQHVHAVHPAGLLEGHLEVHH
mmetsp:Transcript_59402/g.105980  ORF Transcript_59402/g.105980 Transcript_59402/m.105980 type:complete len:242 (-) Transcript_59402:196-921(-)